MTKNITYFVLYAHPSGFGSITIDSLFPIGKDDFYTIRERIVETFPQFKIDDIVIINFIKLER